MKTALKVGLGVVVCVVSLAILLGTIFIPKMVPWAEKQVRDAVKRDCKSCEFSMGPVTLTWQGLGLGDVWIAGGHKDSQRVEFKVRRIVVRPEWTTLLSEHPVIEGVTLEDPEVVFYDGGNKSHKKSESAFETEESDVLVKAVFVEDGEFSYVRDLKGTHTVSKVHHISGDFDGSEVQASFTPASGKMKTFEIKREDGESVVSFMLRGLKQASLNVGL